MKTANISLCSFLSIFLGFSGSSQAQNASMDTKQELMAKFKTHVSTLASEAFEGRAPMTKGDTLAFTYILDHFKQMPQIELLANDGLQTFGFSGMREYVADSSSFKIEGKKLKLGTDYAPSVYGVSGTISDSLIYVSTSDRIDSLAALIKGSPLLLEATFLSDKKATDQLTKLIRKAEKAGASGLVFIAEQLPQYETNRAATRRLPVVFVSPKTGQRLKDNPSFAYTSEIVATERNQTYTNNVVARIPAAPDANPNKECIVIGAHYDHLGIQESDSVKQINWGADDNATGIGTLIELGNYFAAHRHLLKRDVILVAFGAEERGLVGSSYFVNNLPVSQASIKGMFNFDMTGRMVKNTLNIRGIGVVLEAFSQLSTLANPDLLNLYLIQSGQEGTDYASFNRKGIPAVSFSTGIHSDYHSPKDTEDLINYDGMQRVYHFVLPLISRFAFEPGRFTYKP